MNQFRTPLVRSILIALVATWGSACSGNGSGPKTYNDHGISFEYPGNFKRNEPDQREEPKAQVWADAIWLTDDDGIILEEQTAPPGTFSGYGEDIPDEAINAGIRELTGQYDIPYSHLHVGGQPAISFERRSTSLSGRDVVVRQTSVMLVREDATVAVHCQYTPSRQAEITAACDQVLGSLTFTRESSRTTPLPTR